MAKSNKKKCKDCDSTILFSNCRCYECTLKKKNEWLKNWIAKHPNKGKEYYQNSKKKAPTIKCKNCGKQSKCATKKFIKQFCSKECQSNYWKEKSIRKGKNNPGYRNGLYTNVKYNKTSGLHLSACRRYRVKFRKDHDYDYCELCYTSNSPRFETHHIVFASEAPKHKELHNFKNLIYLCIGCHNELHKHKKLRNALVIVRGLNELFNKNLIR